jgi:hypothetical protein
MINSMFDSEKVNDDTEVSKRAWERPEIGNVRAASVIFPYLEGQSLEFHCSRIHTRGR